MEVRSKQKQMEIIGNKLDVTINAVAFVASGISHTAFVRGC
jgi:hypothetical protein